MLLFGLGALILVILAVCYRLSEEKEIERLIRENEGSQVIVIEYRD